jgi:zinc transporter 5/7
VITKWRANERYSYGYFRAEVLGGFINGILLVNFSLK